MERKILQNLIDWKNSKHRKPLILRGARQVGKTYILKEFGKRYYKNVAYFNFDYNTGLKDLFEKTKDPNRLLDQLAILNGEKIEEKDTLIIFDEIQECTEALNSLKYFNELANGYHIVCAGSLLGIRLSHTTFPVGKVDFLDMYPMTFTEFLEADGGDNLNTYLKNIDKIENIPLTFFEPL